jgi:hypothetical protein
VCGILGCNNESVNYFTTVKPYTDHDRRFMSMRPKPVHVVIGVCDNHQFKDMHWKQVSFEEAQVIDIMIS